jgi:pyruvate formate lyase activating enzyme
MKIGGLNRFSLSDFPSKVAAVVFTQGCNFRCPYCHNGCLIPENVPSKLLITEEEFYEFLKVRRNQLDAVVVSGGEPTIHRDLPQFLCRIKAMDFAVKLDTNGSRPEVLRELLKDKLVDYVAMDIKAPLHIYKTITRASSLRINEIKESIVLISKSGVDHQFRTTVVHALLSEKDMRSIQKLVPAGSTHHHQRFCSDHALDPGLRKFSDLNLGGI